MILYITIAIATSCLTKAERILAEKELMTATYIFCGLLWFITLPLLILNFLNLLIQFIITYKNND